MFKFIILLFFVTSSLFATNTEQCIHLLNRTSFGANVLSLTQCATSQTYDSFVQKILNEAMNLDSKSLDLSIVAPPKNKQKATPEERKAFRKELNQQNLALKVWWFEKMLNTEQPFGEKMVLFWHNHFTEFTLKGHRGLWRNTRLPFLEYLVLV